MPSVPSVIGRYQVREHLGQGGMGALYLALDPAIDRLVALKLLRIDSEEMRARFLREARSVGRLQHPHIVTIYDVGEHEDQPFIAMEYIKGETLAEMVRRRAPLSLARKITLMEDLCDGLDYAHGAGLVHRDIKPANLMVTSEAGVLKILDFGIARGSGDSGLDRGRHHEGDTKLHVPGTSVRQDGRPPQRHLLGGQCDLRDARVPSSVSGQRLAGGPAEHP